MSYFIICFSMCGAICSPDVVIKLKDQALLEATMFYPSNMVSVTQVGQTLKLYP